MKKQWKKIFTIYILEENIIKNTLCWVLYSVNDGKDVNEKNLEIMICILYYANLLNNREKT